MRGYSSGVRCLLTLMSGKYDSNLGVKTKAIIAVLAAGVLAGQALTFMGAFFTPAGWQAAKFLCECGWTVIAFPFGWLGFVAGWFTATKLLLPTRYVCLWTGATLNALFWGWVAYRFARGGREQGETSGFDASAISHQIAAVRQTHVSAAHCRWSPLYARKDLVGAARRLIKRSGYFLDKESDLQQLPEDKRPTNQP